ncbi:MAG: hypothetical protein ACOY3K_08705 [Candidatus Omnitrophota bacterium]
MGVASENSAYVWKFSFLVLLGLGLRLALAATVPPAYDIDAWTHYSHYMGQGKFSPYDHVCRYKYSPVWFWVISAVAWLRDHAGVSFVFGIRAFVILIDVLILVLLDQICKHYQYPRLRSLGILAAFFLNPVSIQLSGYSGQFDNTAVLFALLAWALAVFAHEPRWLKSALAFACSLCFKHFTAMLVPLFAFAQKKISRTLFFMLIVPSIFAAILFPYYLAEPHWVFKNVFLYNLHAGYWGWSGVICRSVLFFTGFDLLQQPWFPLLNYFNSLLYLAMLIASYWIVKKYDLLDSILIMFLIFYSFTTQISPQYTVWIIPFAALRPNRYFYAYSLIGGIQVGTFYYCHHFWFRKIDLMGTTPNLMPETFILFRYLTWVVCVLWLLHLTGITRRLGTLLPGKRPAL